MSLVTQLAAARAWLDTIITGGIIESRRGYMVIASENAMETVVRARTSLHESLLVPHGGWSEFAMRWTVSIRIDYIHRDLGLIVALCDDTSHALPQDLIPEVRDRIAALLALLAEVDVIAMPRVVVA